MDDLLSEFLTECFESMTVLDGELLRLERNPDDKELIASIFRLVHTIKGTCGFLDLGRLEAVAHAAENVLGRLRDGDLVATPDVVTLVLRALDRIRAILDGLAATQTEPEGDDGPLIAALNALGQAGAVAPAAAAAEIEPGAAAVDPAPVADEPSHAAGVETLAAQTLRVPVDLLEQLMTLVGELVLTRNQLLQSARQLQQRGLEAPLRRLNQITGELQEGVMKTRMQAIGRAWSKLPRLVRDLGRELGKELDLVMQGGETELDRQVLELIKDPLTHMVRNAADHGLEPPAERRRQGKPATGTITLDAFHDGGHIIIEVGDDGRGLDCDRIARKAVERGLATAAEIAGLSESQIQQFIFHPGFSTAEQVSAVSGRGVGMDVVRTNIEKIGGSIEIRSARGRGSRFTIKIPLTLAIVSALILEAGGERFALPQLGVVELVRAGSDSGQRIAVLNGGRLLRLRDRLLPLASLAGLLGLDRARPGGGGSHVVVVRVGSRVFGLEVDRLLDTEEIVVKPVTPVLQSVTAFSGNTTLGDGSVVMILDPNGLAAMVEAVADETAPDARSPAVAATGERVPMLLFEAGEAGRMAVPLGLVTRLEEIEAAVIEPAGERSVVRYRGTLMPLACIAGRPARLAEGRRPVIVFTDCGRNMGLMVDAIVGVIEAPIRRELAGGGESEVGTAIIDGRPTGLLDVAAFVNRTFGDRGPMPRRVLIVDDSRFVRRMLQATLEAEGLAVSTAESAERALRLRDDGHRFDLIIADIEMPGTNGGAFVQQCRAVGPWRTTTIIALTARAAPSDVERGRLAGFDGHVGRLDRAALIATVARARHRPERH